MARIRGGQRLKGHIRKQMRAKAKKVPKVTIGFFKDAVYDNGTPVTTVAVVNEYGTESRPERPYMRTAVNDMKRPVRRLLKHVLDPKELTVNPVIAGLVGETVKTGIQDSITKFGVIDTGHMKRSVSYEVTLSGPGG